jgi:hypothetical protein
MGTPLTATDNPIPAALDEQLRYRLAELGFALHPSLALLQGRGEGRVSFASDAFVASVDEADRPFLYYEWPFNVIFMPLARQYWLRVTHHRTMSTAAAYHFSSSSSRYVFRSDDNNRWRS